MFATMTDTRLSPEELAAIQERRAQACANNAIEGVDYTPAQNEMFVQFDKEALPHDERIKRAILHIRSGPVIAAE